MLISMQPLAVLAVAIKPAGGASVIQTVKLAIMCPRRLSSNCLIGALLADLLDKPNILCVQNLTVVVTFGQTTRVSLKSGKVFVIVDSLLNGLCTAIDIASFVVQTAIVFVDDSVFALFYRCCQRAGELIIKVVDTIEADTAGSYKQDLSQKTYFSWPTKECVKNLRKNGFRLAKITDFTCAIFNHKTTYRTIR